MDKKGKVLMQAVDYINISIGTSKFVYNFSLALGERRRYLVRERAMDVLYSCLIYGGVGEDLLHLFLYPELLGLNEKFIFK